MRPAEPEVAQPAGTEPARDPARDSAAPGAAARPDAVEVHPWVDLLPRLAAFGLVALGLVGTPLVLLGAYEPALVVPLCGLLLVLLELGWRRAAPRRAPVGRRVLAVSVLAVVVAALSTGLNARYESQHLLVDGDPAVYAVAGQLLAETGSLRIETQAQELFGGGEQLNYAGAGFDAYDDESVVRPSFLHLLPQALAVGAWVGELEVGGVGLGGPQVLLWVNPVISGFALLAVFAFGARLTGRAEWSLVAMTALAVSLPQMHFARDTFSELPAQLLVFAGLALLWDAVASRRTGLGLLAGLVLGVSCTARIDAFFYLVPLVVLATVLVLAGRQRVAAALTAGVLVGAVVGYVDLRVGSPQYLALQSENLDLIFLALAVFAVACGAVLALRRPALRLWSRLHGRALAAVLTGLLVLLSAYAGLVRPYVETGRNLSPEQPTAVAVLQEQLGQSPDPLRSYDELSLQWLTWYLGPVAVGLGLLALAVLVWRTLRRQPTARDAQRTLLALGFVLLFGASTALYLWRPSIIPVHYWATRRFLPVTIPGLLLLAAWLVPQVRGRWRWPAGAGVGAALLVPPLVYASGHWTEREYVPVLAVTEQVCAALEPQDAVLLVGGLPLSTGLPQTITAFCGNPVAVIDRGATVDDVEDVQEAVEAADRRLVLLSPVSGPTLPDGPVPGDFELVVDQDVTVVALTLDRRPDELYRFPLSVWAARP